MSASLPLRIAALQRDVRQFESTVRDAARAASPEHPLTPDAPLVDRLFARAGALGTRAASMQAQQGWDELDHATRLAGDHAVNEALNAARTATQLLHTGPEHHAAATTSVTDPRSAHSTETWIAAAHGRDLPDVRIVGSIPAPAARTVANLFAHVPAQVVEQLDAQGRRSTLFSGSLTDVWGFRFLHGVHPRGWPEGSTWDQVPGVGTSKGLAANPNREHRGAGHGEDSLSLHELGHVVDVTMAHHGAYGTSYTEAWRRGPQAEARRVGALRDYFTTYPEEWYAEAFMKYTRTEQTHASLAKWYPETYAYLERTLGPARF